MACVFPFKVNGITLTQCYTGGKIETCAMNSLFGVYIKTCIMEGLTEPWCSTATLSDGTHIIAQGNFGACPEACNNIGTTSKPTNSHTTTTTTTTATTTTTNMTTSSTTKTVSTTATSTMAATTTDVTTTVDAEPCCTDSGPDAGSLCVFPFIWGGQTYTECAEWRYGGGNQGRLWCSTRYVQLFVCLFIILDCSGLMRIITMWIRGIGDFALMNVFQ